MNSAAARKGWMVAASIGAVEALKDQLGLCRWNYALRSLQQHAKTKTNLIVSYHISSPSNSKSSSNSNSNTTTTTSSRRKARVKKTEEESHNKVMHLSCWGPNSVRF